MERAWIPAFLLELSWDEDSSPQPNDTSSYLLIVNDLYHGIRIGHLNPLICHMVLELC